MSVSKDILEKALKLAPEDKSLIVDGLIRSLDRPDAAIEDIWLDEAEKRLTAYREGRLKGVSIEEVFPSK